MSRTLRLACIILPSACIGSDDEEPSADPALRWTDYAEIAGPEMCCPVIGGIQQRDFCTPGTTTGQCNAIAPVPSLGITDWFLADCDPCGTNFSMECQSAWAEYGPGWGYSCYGLMTDWDTNPGQPTTSTAFNWGDYCWSNTCTASAITCPVGTPVACMAGATRCQANIFDNEEDSLNWWDVGDNTVMCCQTNGTTCIPLDGQSGNCPSGSGSLGFTRKLRCSTCSSTCQGWDLLDDGVQSQNQEQIDSLACGSIISSTVIVERYKCDGELYDPSNGHTIQGCPGAGLTCFD